MIGVAKRILGLALVLTMSTWSQALCPMMLLPQAAAACNMHPANATAQPTGAHDCCPGKRSQLSHQRCDRSQFRSKLSRSEPVMSCCSLEKPPVSLSKTLEPPTGMMIVGRVLPAAMQAPSAATALVLSDEGPPSRGVLSLKDDLRI